MRKRRRPLIVGNWKLNPATLARAEKLWVDIQKNLRGRTASSDVAIAPPLPFIIDLKEMAGSQKIEFFSQDVSFHDEGPHTGEVSVSQLRSFGVKCSIVGHSERRASGETDEEVNKKVLALVEGHSAAIICVGERERDASGDYFNIVEEQIKSALKGVKEAGLKNIVIAYEPVWAIGTGKNAKASDVEEMKLFIQKVLFDLYGREHTEGIRVLYGGSVTALNAEELLREGSADGFLIGGASLDAKQFAAIIKITDKHARFL